MVKIQTKICSKCGIEKPLAEFHKHKKETLGVQPYCKVCRATYADKEKKRVYDIAYRKANKDGIKVYREVNKDKINASNKLWYKANPGYYPKWRKENPEKAKAWRKENPEKVNATVKSWRKKNPEKVKAYNKLWEKANPEMVKTYNNIYIKRRRKRDPAFRLNSNIKGAIYAALNGNKNGRHWETLVDFTLKDLKKHLEKLFTEGMTWSNYGKDGWWIDHKIPISVFNFTKPEHEDFKKCWALSNLQPLWAKENISKSNKLIQHFQPSLPLY